MRWLMVLVLAGCGEAAAPTWNCTGKEGRVDAAFQNCMDKMAHAGDDLDLCKETAREVGEACSEYARSLFCSRVGDEVPVPEPAAEDPDEALAAELAACEADLEAVEVLRMDLSRCPGWKMFRDDCRAWETNIEIICAPGPNRALCGRPEQADYQTLTQYGSLDEAWEAAR